MKRLILLRHAKSSWKDESLTDIERPLNERGRRDAPEMGARLRERGASPSLILSSPAARAAATAELLAAALDYPRERIRYDDALYHADPDTLCRVAAAQDETHEEIVLVAHNPGLTQLANRLLPGLGLGNLPTAGIVAVDLDTARWEGVGRCAAALAYLDYPKSGRGGGR